MKSLIKNYIDNLSIDKLKDIALKNNINLTNYEFEYLINLAKNHWEDMLVNEDKYLKEIENNINPIAFNKIKELFIYYKNRYKGYLF